MMESNNKSVAIMTWYTYHNYGTALQVSALNRKIRQLGYDPHVIQYIPGIRSGEKPRIDARWFARRLRSKVIRRFKRPDKPYTSDERKKRFEAFLERELKETDSCQNFCELHDLNGKFGAFVCGSDQIWSPLCYDDKYFLSFVDDPRRMVAYAPSIGSTEIRNAYIRKEMCRLIRRFEHLSIRERQGAELIRELTGQEAKVVLDPTLLLSQEDWSNCVGSNAANDLPKQKYILCYFLGDDRRYMGYVKRVSKALQIPYYVIPVTKMQSVRNDAIPFEVGPDEFITLIRNAGYVCTDSFHGMAFSVNFNVPFSAFKRFKNNDPKNQNSRVISLLSLLGLEDRLVSENQRFSKSMQACDFSEANRKLEVLKAESEAYLKDALEQATAKRCSDPKCSPWKITDLCCGCGACAAACPKQAITMKRDDAGFWRAFVDDSVCIRCGKCHKVCPMMNISAADLHDAQGLYSIKSASEKVLVKSASGGIAHEIAKACLESGMNICGCVYNADKNSAEHIVISKEDESELSRIQGSKYIQSNTANAMEWISHMESNEELAFFGTPCQVAAVDKLLRSRNLRGNAILVDLICLGVPSAYLWEKHLRDIDSKYGTGGNPEVEFRSKKDGWRSRTISISGNGREYRQNEQKDDFYAFFRRKLCDMESCYECPYRERSAADIRLGDYWGPRFADDKQGVSMVIANSDAGYKMISELGKSGVCSVQNYPLKEYWSVQYPYNLRKPFVRESLIEDLKADRESLSKLRRKYCSDYDAYERYLEKRRKLKRLLKRH